jgi:hypothetical protein
MKLQIAYMTKLKRLNLIYLNTAFSFRGAGIVQST